MDSSTKEITASPTPSKFIIFVQQINPMQFRYLFLLLAFLPHFLWAQAGSLTIFSEAGSFILFLNGAQQNNLPQTNIRVDGMPPAKYHARIVFENKSVGELEENIPVNNAGANSDAVYKITLTGGSIKFTLLPAQENSSASVYTIHYGQPDVTVTNVINTPGGNAKGGFVGITPITNPNNNSNNNSNTKETEMGMSFEAPAPDNQPVKRADCGKPMDENSFKSARERVKNAAYEDARLAAAQNILGANCVSTEQVIQICKLFGFEQTKLSFAKLAYAKTTDPTNYSKVGNVFSFAATKANLNAFISNGGR